MSTPLDRGRPLREAIDGVLHERQASQLFVQVLGPGFGVLITVFRSR